jgi:ParB family protein of integrating conjugative element (PFGI_1 class)
MTPTGEIVMSKTKPIYVPHSIPIGEAIKNVTSRNRMTLRIKGQSEEELAANINQRGPASTAKDLRPGDEHDGAFMVLPIDRIMPYDRNPRTSTNPKYQEIKASIRDRRGLQGNLTVTKRPLKGSEYMLYMGGNTRLQILHELYAETGDKCFYQVNCVYHSWKSEADIMASHLIENEARGDTLFIEKARGLVTLVEEIEKDEGRTLSARDVQEMTAKMGMMVNQATVLLYNFAIANLEVIGNWLTKDNVNLIKRQYAQYDVLARTMDLTGEFKTRFAREVQPLLAAFADDLKAKSSDQSEDASVVALRGAVLEELLRKLDTLAASVLGLQPDAAKRVFVALGSKDALSAEALQTLLNSNGHGSPADAPATVTAAPAPTTRQTKATKATKAAATAEPAPQSGRKETTSEETSSTASVVDVGTPASPVPNVPSATAPAHQLEAGPSETTDAAMETISQNFIDRLVHWCNLTRISQWLRFSNETTIPYLFWLELPPEILESRQHGMWNLLDPELGELTAEQSEIRAIGYRMTALLSGQLGGVIVTRDGKPTSYFPFAFRLPEDSTWRQAAMIPFDSTNVLYNIWDDNLGGVTGRSMDMSLGQDDLLTVLRNPELVGPWMAFCQAYDQWGKCLEQYRRERGATNDLIDLQS